ncbi:hypothetical protein AB4Y87_03655 [Paenarthrobacter sp. RAF54_2]|uniref:hypothetical protein n=1 Tax=Micrococcaceae TaxID=1268 RepID=UPI003F8DEFF5
MLSMLPVSVSRGYFDVALMSATLAIIGYRCIHKFSHIVAVLSAVVFVILLVRIITDSNLGAVVETNVFDGAAFVLGVSLSAEFQGESEKSTPLTVPSSLA